jgi:hypothetical protein
MSTEIGPSGSEIWFKRVLWLGIVANLALSIPTLLMPERIMAMSGLPPATPLLWPRFAGLLLILLSVFYMPAALDPNRYRVVAWLAVLARLAGVVFFLGFQSADYHALGYIDLVFFVPELILLIRLPSSIASPAPSAAAWTAPSSGGAR